MRQEQPELLFFAHDSRSPNSHLPVLLYISVFQDEEEVLTSMKSTFASNKWTNIWCGKIIAARHYNNSTHEVMGVSHGQALLEVGGAKGYRLKVSKGNVLVIPAGVSLRSIKGAGCEALRGYPDGRSWNIIYAKPDLYHQSKEEIANIPIPQTDPLYGKSGGLSEIWNTIF